MSNPVRTQSASVALILKEVENREQEMMALAPRGTEPAMFYAALKLYFASNTKLLDCSAVSVARAMLRVAQTGLELGVSCDILPFGNAAQFSPRYTGLIELSHSAGTRSLNHGVVREGDEFAFRLGSDSFVNHVPKKGNTGKITHAWAVGRTGITGVQIEVMDSETIEARKREFSRQHKMTPLEEIPWYARKTVIREICKYLPKNARFSAALRYDEAEPVEDIQPTAHDAIGEPTGPVSAPRLVREVATPVDAEIVDTRTGEVLTEDRTVLLANETPVPFGESKGTTLRELESKDIASALKWAKGSKLAERYGDFIDAAAVVLANRATPEGSQRLTLATAHPVEADGLPF